MSENNKLYFIIPNTKMFYSFFRKFNKRVAIIDNNYDYDKLKLETINHLPEISTKINSDVQTMTTEQQDDHGNDFSYMTQFEINKL